MATAVYINVYNRHVDDRATFSSTPNEHYEIDEREIKIGAPLPKWHCGECPIVTAYDGNQLTLKTANKTFHIKLGEEIEVCSGMGVNSNTFYCVKLIGTSIIYKGSWQNKNTIMQELEGPIGKGMVFYPNGDRFEGMFHLSFACINGPAHAAEGRYEFADGSYIETAWINTSDDNNPDHWGLNGVFRIHHPRGYESIAMFIRGKRYGLELCLPERQGDKPWVREWFEGEEIISHSAPDKRFCYGLEDYKIDETSKTYCTTLMLSLRNEKGIYCIEQQGGRYEPNQYGNYIYEPYTHVTIQFPYGDIIDHNGTCVREFSPYDGYVNVFCAKTGKSRRELWKKGRLTDNQEWDYDKRGASCVELPNPTGVEAKMNAYVWADGHIEYNNKEWIYDGEVKDNLPHGKGVLVGSSLHNKRHLEGQFEQGVFLSDKKQYDGEIMLHVRSGHSGGSGGWSYQESDMVAKLGEIHIPGFWCYEITDIQHNCITIEFYEEKYVVRPGQPLQLYNEIEGREWSDGCVYDSDEYNLTLTWKE